MRIFNLDKLTSELNNVKNRNHLLQNFINDIEISQVLDSTNSYENFISNYYNEHNIDFPNLAPVSGYVTRGINVEKNHFGIDIAAKFKDSIYSPAEGRVIFSGMSNDFGNMIIMNHPGGFITIFAHNDTNMVTSGSKVNKGQIIGLVGKTGNSQGPHLHFEIWKNNQVLDPREVILEYKKKDVSIR